MPVPKSAHPRNERNVITLNREKMLQAGIPKETLAAIEPFGGMFYSRNLSQCDDFQWEARMPLTVPGMLLTAWGINISEELGAEIMCGYSERGREPRFQPRLGYRLLSHEITTVLTAIGQLPVPETRAPTSLPYDLVNESDTAVLSRFCKGLMRGEDLKRLEQHLMKIRHVKLLLWSAFYKAGLKVKNTPGAEEWLRSVEV